MQNSSIIGYNENLISISEIMILLEELLDSRRVCQICEYEGHGRRITGAHYCRTHNIRPCTLHHPDPKNSNKLTLHGVVNMIDQTSSEK